MPDGKTSRESGRLTGRLAGSRARSRPRSQGLSGVLAALLSGEQGTELIEIAIVLPIYFALVFAITSFGIVMFAYCNASYAAKAAVRYAVVHSTATMNPCTATTIQSIVTPFLWGAPTGGVSINSSWTPSNTVGNTVTVTVTLTYSTGLPYVSLAGFVESASATGIILN
jgi:Flp pilus assembly protein TadG